MSECEDDKNKKGKVEKEESQILNKAQAQIDRSPTSSFVPLPLTATTSTLIPYSYSIHYLNVIISVTPKIAHSDPDGER